MVAGEVSTTTALSLVGKGCVRQLGGVGQEGGKDRGNTTLSQNSQFLA